MTRHLFTRWTVGAAFIGAAVGMLPAEAVAARTSLVDGPALAAVTDNVKRVVGRGDVVPAALGVTNNGDAPVTGLVVELRILDDLDFAAKYDNCWYSVDGNAETAWCSFDDTLAPGDTLALVGPVVATKSNARADKVASISFRWQAKAEAGEPGGERGYTDSLTLQPRTLAPFDKPANVAQVGLKASATPTPSPTAAAPATTDPVTVPSPNNPRPDDEGLPVTGVATASILAAGGALLIIGGTAYLIANRRRTRFEA